MTTGPLAFACCEIPLEDKVAFLRRPEAYPERPRRVSAIETHMSWVFLTERHAYKLKKPVRYDFLDFSTLEARRRDCDEEIRLNRRLAADVYLRVVSLTAGPRGELALDGVGSTVDWLVQMRRLRPALMLDRALRVGRVGESDIVAVAKKLAAFYEGLPAIAIEPTAYRQRFETEVRQNLAELTRPQYRLPRGLAARIASAQLAFLEHCTARFDERVDSGRIVEAHGDLRAEHVCLEPEPVVIDCLEFNRDFRILDPADELAFLALDCERLGAPWVRPLLFETYGAVTGDRPGAALVAFYGSCRAMLRAKIALWHLNEPVVRKPTVWPRLARRYLTLAANLVAAFEAALS